MMMMMMMMMMMVVNDVFTKVDIISSTVNEN